MKHIGKSAQQQRRHAQIISFFHHANEDTTAMAVEDAGSVRISGAVRALAPYTSIGRRRQLRAALDNRTSLSEKARATVQACCARERWIRDAILSISSLQWSFIFFSLISSRRSSELR